MSNRLMKRYKIVFVLPSLKAGGAERIISFLFKNINKDIFDPYLIIIGFKKDNHFKVRDLKVLYLNKKRFRNALFKMIWLIIKIRPQLVFSSISHINLYSGILKRFFFNIKFIAREANIFSKTNYFHINRLLPLSFLNFFYSGLDAIIFQSLDMEKDFQSFFKLEKTKTIVINNPITVKKKTVIRPQKIKTILGHNIIVVGSLLPKKGHDRIIDLLSSLNMEFNLNIIGDGYLKKNIKEQVAKAGMENKVTFHGIQKDLTYFYETSDFLIQGSYFEGFPNVVLEALSFGIPCFIFDAPGGHNEMIKNGFNGFLLKEKSKSAFALEAFLSFNWDREAIILDAYERFNSQKIIKQYEELFIAVLQK